MHAFSKLTLAATIALSTASLAFAQQSDHSAHHPASTQAAPNSSENEPANSGVTGQKVEGEVRKVSKAAGKITIRHGELKDLGMPAMTMVFRVKEPAMLDQVKTGDKIKFVAERVDGQLTVTQMDIQQ